jgi:hypothetical protein
VPVVVVAAPPLAPDVLTAALGSVAVAVAGPLGLAPGDVVVSHTLLGAAVAGTESVAAWPVVTLHGSPRDPVRMQAAAAAAAEAVAAAWAVGADETWVHWLVRRDPS